MRKKGKTVLWIALFLIGLSLLLYPSISNWWNSMRQTRVISDYSRAVDELPEETYEELLLAARAYNDALPLKADRYEMTESEEAAYKKLLCVEGNGVMGYVEIPKINVSLPIYHTTREDILQFAAGHLPGTSLPIGGLGTHCVLSGHRGLPSAKLFTDLDKMQEGDIFYITVLKQRLTYEVDQILIVDPENMEALEIDPHAELLTLVTCTPYGVNTHRLLVRGHRIENHADAGAVYFTSEAIQIEPAVAAPFIAVPLLLLVLLVMAADSKSRAVSSRIKREARKENGHDKRG